MPKLPTVTTTPTPESERVGVQIDEVREHITALNTELCAVDQQIVLLAAQEDLDQPAVESLRVRKVAIVADLELFNQRLGIFKEKKAEAECQEAQAQIAEIEAEDERLREQEAELFVKYGEGIRGIEQIVQSINTLQHQRFTQFHEAEYVAVLHGLAVATLVKVELPVVEDLRELSAAILSVARRPGNYSDEWSRKASRLKTQSQQAQREPAPVPASRSEALPQRGTVSISMKPDHAGDEKPNQLQELLRG